MSISEQQFREMEQRLARNKPKSAKPANAFEGAESELHSQIEAELKRRRYYFVHSRTDKRTTTQLGVPDFIIAMPDGETVWCEVKRKNGKLSPEQTTTRHVLLALGHRYVLAYSMDDFLKGIE